MGNSQLPRPRIGLKRTSAASVRGWPGQPSGASRGPPLWLSVYLPGEADHREEGTTCQVCILHHPLDHHGCRMDGRSRTLKDFSWQGLQGSLADWCDRPWWHHGHLDQKSLWRHEDLHLFGSFRMDLPILHQQHLTNTISPNYDNPNMPRGRFAYNNAMFWPTKGETGMQIHENLGLYPKDPGPSWKKWEDKEE